MKKLVNGVLVDMQPAEATAIQSEWDAYSAAYAAAAPERQRLADQDAAIAGDATVQSLRGMTVAEFDAWWSANVTTLAQALNVLKRVTRVVIRRAL